MVALLILCLTALLNCLASLSLKAAASSEVPNLSTVNAISAALIGFGPYVRFMLLAILFWVSAFFVYFWALRTWPASQAYAITTGITIKKTSKTKRCLSTGRAGDAGGDGKLAAGAVVPGGGGGGALGA